ncbi:hypothetical protein C8R43DRAFT_573800 [Mycena crocata]|nr:hypothetical protein C8R43DRAFT_573800 [Mycena crocata]
MTSCGMTSSSLLFCDCTVPCTAITIHHGRMLAGGSTVQPIFIFKHPPTFRLPNPFWLKASYNVAMCFPCPTITTRGCHQRLAFTFLGFVLDLLSIVPLLMSYSSFTSFNSARVTCDCWPTPPSRVIEGFIEIRKRWNTNYHSWRPDGDSMHSADLKLADSSSNLVVLIVLFSVQQPGIFDAQLRSTGR